jgi:predicted DNA-binding transcriptional regulator AlpA
MAADLDRVLTELRAIRREAAAPLPRLLDRGQAAAYCGMARTKFGELYDAGELPRARRVPVYRGKVRAGDRLMWLRADLDKWLDRLPPDRRPALALAAVGDES